MEIRNSNLKDVSKIMELYRIATAYMKSKNQVAWPEFSRELIVEEIEDLRQWKLLINNEIACIWATTLNDELIWGNENNDSSVYIHRIATNPDYRGQNLVKQIVDWADNYCIDNNLKYVRMDTVGLNKGLIGHYRKLGFEFLGTKELDNVDDLPEHYSEGPVCLFQRTPIMEKTINYNNRRLKPVKNSENGETTEETIFEYKQDGEILTSKYSGGQIQKGHLIGLVDEKGNIEMRYHQINIKGELMTGKCISKPEVLASGKIRLYETWEWTSGDKSSGESILEEI